MKISRNLPQFADARALLLVSGEREVVVYFVFQGVLKKADAYKLQTPKYSDREGFVGRRGRGLAFRGAPLAKSKDAFLKREFLRALLGIVKKNVAAHDVAEIYLFAPAHVIKKLRADLSPETRRRVKATFPGHFLHLHPFELLEKF